LTDTVWYQYNIVIGEFMKNINNKKINPCKHVVNVDIIESYILVKNLSKHDFCELCNIELNFLNIILNRRLTYIPYKLLEIADIIKVDFMHLINIELVKKFNMILFSKDTFLIWN